MNCGIRVVARKRGLGGKSLCEFNGEFKVKRLTKFLMLMLMFEGCICDVDMVYSTLTLQAEESSCETEGTHPTKHCGRGNISIVVCCADRRTRRRRGISFGRRDHHPYHGRRNDLGLRFLGLYRHILQNLEVLPAHDYYP
jgi:hypothetical protein